MEMLRKSWGVPLSMAFVWLLLPSVVTAAVQLPPEIQADRYLLQAERAIQEQDFQGAKTAMDSILELQGQHDLELPEPFAFRYAEVLERLGIYDEAIEFVTEYLTLTGRDGEFYREALELLNAAEGGRAAAEGVIARMEFVQVPAGSFRMGCVSVGNCRDREQPVHEVMISRPFALSKYEVMQSEWEAVMGTNPSEFSGCARCPVEQVSWDDVQDFIGRLNAVAGEERYWLPTEAEWEYAARAETTTEYSWGNEVGRNRANCNDCGSRWDGDRTAPVGSFGANAWGLHDMHGNVWEWVQDCWNGSYKGAPKDGSARESGDCGRRVARGGSWKNPPGFLRAAFRVTEPTGNRLNLIGFRVARTLD